MHYRAAENPDGHSRRRSRLLPAICAAVLVISAMTAPLSAHAAVSSLTQALHIQAAYDVSPSVDLACGGLRAKGVGTADGTPIGPSTWADNECASLVARLGKVVINGNLVIAGTHGTLNIAYTATAPLPITLTIHPSGTFTITSGTGDFAGATGYGTVTAKGSLIPPGPATAQLSGSITLP